MVRPSPHQRHGVAGFVRVAIELPELIHVSINARERVGSLQAGNRGE